MQSEEARTSQSNRVVVILAIAALGLIVGIVMLVFENDLGLPLAVVGGATLLRGLPLLGAIPPYLAGKEFGISFSHAASSPFRWAKGKRDMRAFLRLQRAGAEISFPESGAARIAGVDLEALAGAVEIRRRKGYPLDTYLLSAASIAGHDPGRLAAESDILEAMRLADNRRAV